MIKNQLVKPFVKWAGGKRQLLPEITKYVPKKITNYYEPFLGGGALWFDLQPNKFVVNDINPEMVNVYRTIQANVEGLIEELRLHRNEESYFYSVREQDRLPDFKTFSPERKAARILFLNKTCFNGLFRVNSQGFFNVPFGKYQNPDIVNEITLRAVSNYLNESEGEILNGDYAEAVRTATKGSFVYFDPPYDPVSDTASFTGYTLDGFNKDEQRRLKTVCDDLHRRGCKFLLSNSSTEFIHQLYREYRIEVVQANRAINSVGSGRGRIDEVLIRNYE